MSLFSSDVLRLVHLFIVAPATIALVFLIGPLGAADEQMHLFRAAAISHCVVTPRLIDRSVRERGAGGHVDAALQAWVGRFAPQPNAEIVPTSLKALWSSTDVTDAGIVQEHIHSNTAIYPPLLYAQSAAAIRVARDAGMPVVTWLYVARFANALVAIGIFAALMRTMPTFRPLILIASALPIMLYQTATVSADAVLLPVSVAFACLLARMFVTSPPTSQAGHAAYTAWLAIAMLILCVGKVAYLPFAVLPPLAARAVDGRWSPRAKALAAMALLSLVLWACWAWIVHDKVFTIRPDIPIDPRGQLKWMIGHPLAALGVFGNTLVHRAAFIGYSAMGSHLGDLNFRTSHALIFFAMIALIVATALSSRMPPIRPRWFTGVVWIVAAAVAIIVPLLLYLQFNAVGQSTIEGIQGRYFLPVLFLVMPFVPRALRRVDGRFAAMLTPQTAAAVAVVFAVVSAGYMVWHVSQSYWTT
jgi:hypothetical protein